VSTELVMRPGLPSIADAKFPTSYEAAKIALAECSRIDECQDWADRTAALASYARQADDETLLKTATRIQARAIRRCGELLREIEPVHTGRPPKELGEAPPLITAPLTRAQAARDAGLSDDQRKQALRVANVPAEEFEEAVESEAPPTVTALAERGKQSAPKPLDDFQGRNPRDFHAYIAALGYVRDLHAFALQTEPKWIAAGASARERARVADLLPAVLGWLSDLMDELGKDGAK
jgi:hypothetical protein